MAQLLSDRRDIDFVLYEQLKIEDILKRQGDRTAVFSSPL